MPNFKYKARDKFARLVSGIISSDNKDNVARKLQDMGYVPISVEEAHELVLAIKILDKFKHISLEELNYFTRQLYSLQKSGIPLLSSLTAISQETKSRYFKTIVEEIAADIKAGLSFSEAIKKHHKIFGDIYISMIKVAETSGAMVNILDNLSGLLEQEIDTRSKIKTATRYPMLAFFVLCLGFFIVVTFVIPRFAAIYGQFNAALPLPTRVMIASSIIIKKFWLLFIILVASLGVSFIKFINSKSGRPIWDNFKLKFPVLGKLVSMLIMARFARITALLMKSGISILEVLDLSANTSGNIIISRAIINIRDSVNKGKGISEPMRASNLFSPAVVQMISIGEQTGRVDELLVGIADYYDRETGYMIRNLSTYLEPLLIFVLAFMVLGMALAIFLPMWNLIKIFR